MKQKNKEKTSKTDNDFLTKLILYFKIIKKSI